MDADHIHDLQLGGTDVKSALWMLQQKVNRSLGAQIQQQLKTVQPGTQITKIYVEGLS